MDLLTFNTLMAHHPRDPVCTFEEGLELHQRAAMNYKHVLEKLRNITTDAEISLGNMYLGRNRVAGVPQTCNLHRLFIRFNDIACANFVAHPSLDDEANALIFYYGMDKLHTVNIHLNQSYFNIVLAVFAMASNLAGFATPKLQNSAPLWCAYIYAWIESITERGEDDFMFREEYLRQWRLSKYNLTLFTKGQRRRMNKELNVFKVGKPPVEGNPIDFLHKCKVGVFGGQEFKRVGMAMALHWIFAQIEYAQEEKDKKEEASRRVAEEKAMHAVQARTSGDGEREDDIDEGEEGDEMDMDMDEHDVQDDVQEDGAVDIELVNDEMEVDVDGLKPIPKDIDLTRVEWDADWMQALLGIDMSLEWKEGLRPESGRMQWIDPGEGFGAIFTEGDQLADEVKNMLRIF